MSQHLEARPYTPWQLIKLFWQSEHRVFAYIFLFSVLLMTILLVGLDVAITNWYNYFYNALQDYDLYAAINLMWIFTFLAAVYIVIAVYRYYLQQFLALRWRRWLTEQFVSRWLMKRGYYYLETFDEHTDNPDQRIQEDIGSLVSFSLDLTIGLISAITTICAFVYVLWTLSGTLTIPLGALGVIHVKGYLVWISIIYALVGTFCTFKIGRPLVPLNFEQQRREANFRYAAVDLRTHSEDIALYRGEHHQETVLRGLLYRLLDNWYMIILRQKLLLWFTAGYNQISVLVPLVVALPNYFNKVFKLGGLIQTLAAFNKIQDALSFIVNSYTRIAEWQAIMQRLITFLNHMYELEQDVSTKDRFVIKQQEQPKISVKNLTINTPQNETLLSQINEEFVHGKNYWIRGNSGIGKSTFVRAIAGIWPYGVGEITLPEQNVMFIPQKVYMPIGTLRDSIIFPDKVFKVTDAELIELLNNCGLHELVDQLNQTKHWSENLSPGELQRIAFARVLIHKPDWVFLDESTSALDLDCERHLYELLKSELPSCSVISIGHRPSLAAFHDYEFDLEEYRAERSDVSENLVKE